MKTFKNNLKIFQNVAITIGTIELEKMFYNVERNGLQVEGKQQGETDTFLGKEN